MYGEVKWSVWKNRESHWLVMERRNVAKGGISPMMGLANAIWRKYVWRSEMECMEKIKKVIGWYWKEGMWPKGG